MILEPISALPVGEKRAWSEPRPSLVGRIKSRLLSLLRSAGLKHGLVMSTAMIVAGGLDYIVNVLAGRWLAPVDYGMFVSVAAMLQVLLYISIAIRNVVAFYTAEFSTQDKSTLLVGPFLQRSWRWAWQWGLLATVLMGALSIPSAHVLRFSGYWPLWAAAPMVLALFLRPITDGALQGMQAFGRMGAVQVTQAFLRLIFTAIFIWLGYRATGAIFALSLACLAALVLALWWLRGVMQGRGRVVTASVSWNYSAYTLLGLAVFGVLANFDVLFVKHFFTPAIAGNYGPVATIARINLFLPVAMGIIVLPKSRQRHVEGRDSRPIAAVALAAVLLPGLGVASICFVFPGFLVRTVFGNAYSDPGILLGLASLAATLYAGLNIWLNYALSLKQPVFVGALCGVLFLQGLGMYLFGREHLVYMSMVMVLAGLAGNCAGFIVLRSAPAQCTNRVT